MFEIFNQPLYHQIGTANITGLVQALNVLNNEYTRLEGYHRQNISFVSNQHVLVRLLSSLVIPSGDIQSIAMDIGDQFDNQMTGLGIGSPYGRPDFSINSWFYNKRTYEVLVQDSSLFDAEEVYNNWQDTKPIRVLHHPFNDMSLAFPNGKYVSNANPGYAVIAINPAMLAIQYKGYLDFCQEQNKGMMKAPAIYLSQFPIFNMLKDHVDICLRNRLTDILLGNPLSPYKSSYSMAINNPTTYVDAALASVIKQLKDQSFKFDKVLEIMPAFSVPTQRETMPFPLNASSHYTDWIFDIARAPILDFLVRYGNMSPNYQNLDIINDIKRSITEMETDKSIPQNASPVARTYFNNLKNLISAL